MPKSGPKWGNTRAKNWFGLATVAEPRFKTDNSDPCTRVAQYQLFRVIYVSGYARDLT